MLRARTSSFLGTGEHGFRSAKLRGGAHQFAGKKALSQWAASDNGSTKASVVDGPATHHFDRPDQAAAVVAIGRSRLLAVVIDRRFLGFVAVLRIRPDVPHQLDDRLRARVRRTGSGERSLSDRRPERALFRTVPRIPRRSRTRRGGSWKIGRRHHSA